MEILKYLNDNSGALMVIITLVYVIATVAICWANIKSANASREQLEEVKEQFEESNRAIVTVDLETIREGLIVLKIQNVGKRCATKIKVHINDEFILNLPDNLGKNSLQKLSKAEFLLGSNQKKYVYICANPAFKKAAEQELIISTEYKDGNRSYCETIRIDLNQYLWELIYNSPTEDLCQEIKGINESIKYIKDEYKKERFKKSSEALEKHIDEYKEKFNL